MSTLSSCDLGFEIVESGLVVGKWDWRNKPCSEDFARLLVDHFRDKSLPCNWIKAYLESPSNAVYGHGNWLTPTSDGRLLHYDGSVSEDTTYEPVSLTEAVLDIIGLIRNPVLAA